jgi:hypothetical protein
VVGVVPGSYELRLASSPAIAVDVPRGHTGVYGAGILVVEGSP